jgi:hypothetical protein
VQTFSPAGRKNARRWDENGIRLLLRIALRNYAIVHLELIGP